jgi:small-conductance mechanosensitive channel
MLAGLSPTSSPSAGLTWSDIDSRLHPIDFLLGLLLFAVFLLLARVLRWIADRLLQRPRIDMQVRLLVTRLVFLGTVLLGVVGFFGVWLRSPTWVFGSFGIFALAFSLAFQDILKNFIAGVFLLLERPFRIGDEITVDGHTGTVDNVEIRTTTLRTEDGEEVLIPNSLVYTETIVNRSRYPIRMFTLTAKLPPGQPLDGVAERVKARLEALPEVTKEPPPHVGLLPNIDGGVTLEVRYWLDYRRHNAVAVQAALGAQIYQALQANASAPAK